MPESPGQTIDHLRAFMDVVSDPELARKLRIDKSTISSWRSRGSVPNRYRQILSGSDPHAYEMPPAGWGEHEVFAFRLALFRYCRARSLITASDEYPTILRVFSYEMGFFRIMAQSQRDLAAKKVAADVTFSTALALVLHDYVTSGQDGVQKDRDTLRIDPLPEEDSPGML